MSDEKEQLKNDVEGLGSVESLGKVEAYILDLKAREDAEEPDRDKRQGDSRPSGDAS